MTTLKKAAPKPSMKKATAKVRELMDLIKATPPELKIAVTWYELEQLRIRLLSAPQTWQTGVRIAIVRYLFLFLRGEPIALPKDVLTFLNGD